MSGLHSMYSYRTSKSSKLFPWTKNAVSKMRIEVVILQNVQNKTEWQNQKKHYILASKLSPNKNRCNSRSPKLSFMLRLLKRQIWSCYFHTFNLQILISTNCFAQLRQEKNERWIENPLRCKSQWAKWQSADPKRRRVRGVWKRECWGCFGSRCSWVL